MLELLAVVIIIGIAFFMRSPKTKKTASEKTPSSPSPSRFTRFKNRLPTVSQKWLKVAVGIIVVLLLFFFWDSINVPGTGWVAEKFGWEENHLANWWWLLIPIVLIAWILKNQSARKVGGTFVSIVMTILALGFIVFTLSTGITVVDWLDGNYSTTNKKVKCTEPKELAPNPRIDRGGRDIILCAKQAGTVFYAYPLAGHQLKVQVSPVFEHGHLLGDNRTVWDFVEVKSPGTFHGSTAHSWRIVVKHDVWRFSGLDHIRLHVSAIPSR